MFRLSRERAIHCSSAPGSLPLLLGWMQAVGSHGEWCRREDNAHCRSGSLAVASLCPNPISGFNPAPWIQVNPQPLRTELHSIVAGISPCEMGQHIKTLIRHFQYDVFSYVDFCSVTVAFLVLSHCHLRDRDSKQWTLKICSELHAVNQLT